MLKKTLPFLGYGIVIVLVFGPVLFPGTNQLIFGDDIHRVWYFYRQFFNDWLRQGIFPWWNPYNFSGAPFIANPQVNIWYPVNWLFVVLPLPLAYSWHIAFHVFFAMCGMYILLMSLNSKFEIRNSKLSSWVGGVVFGLSGFFMARVWAGHVDVIAAASWMPWVFGLFWNLGTLTARPLRRGMVAAAGVFALQLYAGYQTMAFFTVEAVGLALIGQSIAGRSMRPFMRAFGAGLLGIGLAALQIVPVQEFFLQSIRTLPLSYEWISYGALTLPSLKQLFSPFFFGDQISYNGPPPNYPEHAMFVGVVALTLAILVVLYGMVQRPKKYSALIFLFGFIAVGSLWVSLANHAPYDLQNLLWKLVPMYHYLRIPPRHLILFIFAASVLVGLSLQMVRHTAIRIVLALAIIAELVPFAKHFIATKPVPETRHNASLVATLQKDQAPHRLLQNFGVWVSPRDSLDFDSAMPYRIFSATGYDPSILRRYYEFIDAANGATSPSILQHDVQVPYLNVGSRYTDFLNIKYIMVPRAYDPIGNTAPERLVRVEENAQQNYRIYENKTVLPRFYFVSQVRALPGRESVLETIRSGSLDVGKTVILTSGDANNAEILTGCKEKENGEVLITSYTPNRIELATKTSCDAFLVSSEVYYPGWEAYIDDKKTDIYEGNLAFRTIFIPKGNHTIVYQYVPKIFVIGAAISLLTLLLVVRYIRRDRFTT